MARLNPRPGPIYSRLQYLGFGPFANNFSTLSDVNALIPQIGGNGGVAAFYDRRVNVTGNPNVTSWADARTVGGGPTLVAGSSGTTSPTVSGAGSVITWASTSHPLTFATFSASTGVFGSGPCTIIGVLSTASSSTGLAMMSLDCPTPSCDLLDNTGPLYANRFSNTSIITNSAVATGATIRCVATSVNAAGTQGFIQVYNQSQVASSAGASTSGATSFTIGGQTGSSTVQPCVVSAAIVLNFLASTTQIQTIGAWAVTNHSAVAA